MSKKIHIIIPSDEESSKWPFSGELAISISDRDGSPIVNKSLTKDGDFNAVILDRENLGQPYLQDFFTSKSLQDREVHVWWHIGGTLPSDLTPESIAKIWNCATEGSKGPGCLIPALADFEPILYSQGGSDAESSKWRDIISGLRTALSTNPHDDKAIRECLEKLSSAAPKAKMAQDKTALRNALKHWVKLRLFPLVVDVRHFHSDLEIGKFSQPDWDASKRFYSENASLAPEPTMGQDDDTLVNDAKACVEALKQLSDNAFSKETAQSFLQAYENLSKTLFPLG
jgi:hypothetical protein